MNPHRLSGAALRRWAWVHTWSSLVCTLFMLLLCLTGLPLIFHDEIEHWLDEHPPLAEVAPGTPPADIDALAAAALAAGKGSRLNYLLFDESGLLVTLGTSELANPGRGEGHAQRFDLRDGRALPEEAPHAPGFMDLMLRLHTDLFLGLPGLLFLGAMGLLLLASLVSGTVLYAPFMRRLAFGEVRRERGARLRWLDRHNLLGIATLAWLLVVGATGSINTLELPIGDLWRGTHLAALQAAHAQEAPPRRTVPPSAAIAAALRAAPSTQPASVIAPGMAVSGPRQYLVVLRGDQPATRQRIEIALVDGETGRLSAHARMPWYVQALSLSQPLHFGDYGGLPMKLLWAALDLLAIVVLGSGLYLWFGRRRARRRPDGESGSRTRHPRAGNSGQ